MKIEFLFSIVVACIFAAVGQGQIDTPIPPERDMGDLYSRMARSQFVLIGDVISQEAVGKRMTPEIETKSRIDLSASLGGSLYTIQVKEILCRFTDFPGNKANSLEDPQIVHIFVSRNQSPPSEQNGAARLLRGQAYLLFLVEPNQQHLTAIYNLDSNQIYYGGEEGNRGVIPLSHPGDSRPPAQQAPVLDKVTKLCEAMRPIRPQDKLAAVNLLADSGDPVLAKEAEIAATALRSAMRASPNDNH